MQDGATSHTSNLVQNFLEETIPRRYVKKDEWPPKSPDANPLDYYFWSRVKDKVYEGRLNKHFTSEYEMIQKIKSVWKECASNLSEIRKAMKQFRDRLKAVHDCNGSSIIMQFAYTFLHILYISHSFSYAILLISERYFVVTVLE